jgi:DNA repair protein RadC
MKIKEYKVCKNDKGHPCLMESNSYNWDKDLKSYVNIVSMLNQCFHMDKLNEEYAYVISFDTVLNCLGVFELSHGTTRHTSITNKELYTFLLLTGADQYIIAHNHPDGQLEISDDDIKMTSNINAFSSILNINMIESIIISKNGFKLIHDEMLSDFRRVFKNGG